MKTKLLDLGLCDFDQAWQVQKRTLEDIKKGILDAVLILCRHYPVVTLGRQAKKESLKATEEDLSKKGISLFSVERGGDATYHGPGQLIAYPVFNLSYFKKDIHFFLRRLEDVAIGFLAELGISGLRYEGLTGAWVEKRKIASLGIAIRNWITYHGLSINIQRDDLANFCLIRPCGMDIEMTSLEDELGQGVEPDSVKRKITEQFKNIFGFVA
ncbi:MAG: lipoyl(octanoyl) transferase LipB [Candidatus Omnitrophica bacterium]|nr:lipoyl(octanoyl) transferase LipB [Candidatus Omnitrophota bacterium]